MKNVIYSLIAVSAFFTLYSCETTSSGDSTQTTKPVATNTAKPKPAASTSKAKPYPLSTCLVTGEGLESKKGSITQVYQGQEVKFCCKPCQKAFNKNPETFLAKIR